MLIRLSQAGIWFALAILTLGPTTLVAQDGFLKKLEEAVKSQLSETSSEELPAPKAKTESTPPPRPLPLEPSTPPVPPPADSVGNQPVQPQTPQPQVEPRGGKSYLGLEVEETLGGQIGVRITSLADQSPAWKAGFQIGDRIQAINGYAIAKLDDMVRQLAKSSPGQSVRFLVRRGDRTLQLTAVLMDAGLASATGRPVPGAPEESVSGEPVLGVTVNDLSNSFRRQFGITVFRGAAVSTVLKGSPADTAGIRAGEAIVEANGVPIDGAVSMGRFIASTRPGQKVLLTVYRGGFSRTVEVVMGLEPGSARVVSRPGSSGAGAGPSVNGPSMSPTTSVQPSIPSFSQPSGRSILERDPGSAVGQTEEVQRLRTENAQLAEQLRATQEQLRETQKKLDRILELVNGNKS